MFLFLSRRLPAALCLGQLLIGSPVVSPQGMREARCEKLKVQLDCLFTPYPQESIDGCKCKIRGPRIAQRTLDPSLPYREVLGGAGAEGRRTLVGDQVKQQPKRGSEGGGVWREHGRPWMVRWERRGAAPTKSDTAWAIDDPLLPVPTLPLSLEMLNLHYAIVQMHRTDQMWGCRLLQWRLQDSPHAWLVIQNLCFVRSFLLSPFSFFLAWSWYGYGSGTEDRDKADRRSSFPHRRLCSAPVRSEGSRGYGMETKTTAPHCE